MCRCWLGALRAGQADGLWYAMGYSGHGAQLATHMGEMVAGRIMGEAPENPWHDLGWSAVPGHFGKPWFLPLVGACYGMKGRVL